MSYTHKELVDFAVEWLKLQGFDGTHINNHGGVAFVQDKEIAWKVHQMKDASDGIYTEFAIRYPRGQRLYGILAQLKQDVNNAQLYLEHIMDGTVPPLEKKSWRHRRLEKIITHIARGARLASQYKYLGPTFIDVVGISKDRKVAIECGNTKYKAEDYPSYFSEVIFIPYPEDGNEPQLVWQRR